MDRNEVSEALAPYRAQRVTVITDPSKVRLGVEEDRLSLSSGRRHFRIADDGARAVLNFTKVPIALMETLEPKLGRQVVMDVLRKQPGFAIVTREDDLVDIRPPERLAPAADPDRVLDTIEGLVDGEISYDRVIPIKRTGLELQVATPRIERPVVVGDMVQAGAAIRFSPIGDLSPMVESYTRRYVCTNGAISTAFAGQYVFSGGRANGFWGWLRASFRQALDSLEASVAEYQQLAATEIAEGHETDVLEGLAHQARLTGREREALMTQAVQNRPHTMWDAWNLLTFVGSHVIVDPVRQGNALRHAGRLAGNRGGIRRCAGCGHEHWMAA